MGPFLLIARAPQAKQQLDVLAAWLIKQVPAAGWLADLKH